MRLSARLFFLLLAAALPAASQAPSIERVPDHNGWGWEAYVMQNGLITVATMPAIGARVMQYDLGDHASIFVNDAMKGRTETPRSGAAWPNFGGFKNWPAPQDAWGWPPPPNIDFGPYAAEITAQTADSVVLTVSGVKEKWLTPNIRFVRRATVYRGTSRVRMQQTLLNEGAAAVNWGVWDITQAIVNHPGERDFENFWVYFPVSKSSVFGPSGVRTSASSKAWKGEVAPGVYGVQFLPENKKIFADSPEGWIAYADRRHNAVYAKTYDLFPGTYPDGGAHNEVWISGDPLYLEVEVVGPVVRLEGLTGQTTFTEDWWAARMRTPVLDVNRTGAVGRGLSYDAGTGGLSGAYGVFWTGTAAVAVLDAGGGVLWQGPAHAVSPSAEFVLSDAVSLPEGASSVEVRVTGEDGTPRGALESASVADLTGVPGTGGSAGPAVFTLAPNYPNPFNPSTTLVLHVREASTGSLRVFDSAGREVATLASGRFGAGAHRFAWDATGRAAGVYVAKAELGGRTQRVKMTLLK